MGFGAFLVFTFIVLALTALVVAAITYFLPNAPAYVPKLLWGLAVFIILYTLAQAMGLLGHDVPIPRVR
jgi:hypothetical protein